MLCLQELVCINVCCVRPSCKPAGIEACHLERQQCGGLQVDTATEKLLAQMQADQAALRSQMEEQSTLLRALHANPPRSDQPLLRWPVLLCTQGRSQACIALSAMATLMNQLHSNLRCCDLHADRGHLSTSFEPLSHESLCKLRQSATCTAFTMMACHDGLHIVQAWPGLCHEDTAAPRGHAQPHSQGRHQAAACVAELHSRRHLPV